MGANAALVAAELTANSVLHAASPFTIAVSSPDGALRISVHDVSPVLPVPRRREAMAESGRGLGLVAALAEGWGAERTDDGKVVWAELRPEI
jgi:anti-sigma regulatory factor (Ser/Thr protein kinase)